MESIFLPELAKQKIDKARRYAEPRDTVIPGQYKLDTQKSESSIISLILRL
jgi:hypothetical protein